jgi:5-methylcytosine-specific restriction endonuclease McrA
VSLAVRKRGSSHATRLFRQRILREGHAVCHICGGAIDVFLPREHSASLEIDHAVPVAFGGGDETSNLRPTHKRCNRQRGAGRQPKWLDTPGDRSASW